MSFTLRVLLSAVFLFVVCVPYVSADVPLAARLLAEPYSSTGVRVTVDNGGSMYGLANDGTKAYILNSSGNIVTVPFSSITMTAGGQVNVSGTEHTVAWGGASPSWPNSSRGSIAYSKGCIFTTSAEDNNTPAGTIDLYCVDVSDYSVTEIAVPAEKPLPNGYYFANSNLVDFPDGRVGKVSRYESVGGGNYRSILRLYTISGTGKNATLTWSEDIIMGDNSNWAIDEHGLGTDGTYLYRIQWKDVNPNTKVWQLQSNATSTVAYSGSFTQPFGNMHFLSHNHIDNYYLIGHYTQNQFFITTAADPGPGPGNPLTPTFAAPSYNASGFTTQVSNYDAAFTWTVGATLGSASIGESGLITITGLSSGQSSTVTATTTRSGYPTGSATTTGTLPDVTAPTISSIATSSVTSTGATITWNTNEAASTRVVYGIVSTSTYSAITNTSPRVSSHSASISSLMSCTTYYYAVVSTDAAGNTGTSTTATLLTDGCEYTEQPIVSSSGTVSTGTTATTTVTNSGKTFSVAATATSTSLVIQVRAIANDTVLSSYGRPNTSPTEVGLTVFDVKAIINGSTVLDSFDHPVTITYEYTDQEINGLDESTLKLYHYHNSAWAQLSDCSVDASANSISCTTDSFSIFGLFGSSQSSSSDSSSAGGAAMLWCSGPMAPGWNPNLPGGGCVAVATQAPAITAACPAYTFTRTLRFGMRGEDVRNLQKLMNCLGFALGESGPGSPGNETNLFVERTFASVQKFQDTYAAAILTPLNLTKPTGIFAASSQKKARALMQQ